VASKTSAPPEIILPQSIQLKIMQIQQNSVVTLNYKMFNADGQLIDQNAAPIVYLHGGYDNILPAVEAALENKKAGDQVVVELSPEDGFGEYDADYMREEEVSAFPPDIEIGMQFETLDETTGEHLLFTVRAIEDGKVTLDGNHPLAGMHIRFETEVLEVRAATDEEVAHGHVHGEGGHHH